MSGGLRQLRQKNGNQCAAAVFYTDVKIKLLNQILQNMKTTIFHHLAFRTLSGLSAATLMVGVSFAQSVTPSPVFASTNSVSDILGVAHDTDPLLVNPWGLTPGPEGNLHVNNNGTGVNGFYAPGGHLITGSNIPHAFTIPQATVTSGTLGSPTGVVLNKLSYLASGSNGFVITGSSNSGPAHYLVATEDGVICGYNETVDPASAVTAYDGSTTGAGYTGLALSFVTGTDGVPHHRLYAANFRAGRIDVFKPDFSPVVLTGSNTFTDPLLPTPPAGLSWSPFNVHHVAFMGGPVGKPPTIQRRILVAYALHSGTSNPMNDVPGAGNGAVAVFTPDGAFIRELVPANSANGPLNSPWGMAIDHASLARFGAHAIVLVGNHGDGTINAYAFDAGANDGGYIGQLKNNEENPLAFDGLWALHFGPKVEKLAQFLTDVDELGEDGENLYFSAGIVGESHGLVGRIVVPKLK